MKELEVLALLGLTNNISSISQNNFKDALFDTSNYFKSVKNDFFKLIIDEASIQASGHEGNSNLVSNSNFGYLASVSEKISRKDSKGKTVKKDNFTGYYDLKQLNENCNIYPSSNQPKENLSQIFLDYYSNFKNEFNAFYNKTPDLSKNLITLTELIKKYFWCFPIWPNSELNDVSLYDHSRLTAILSTAMYKYHTDTNSLNEESIKNRNLDKYLLVAGDISGIQKFIYSIPAKNALKAMRGRSFFMQILPLLISKHILQKVGMNEIQIIYSTGGHFYLILPNTNEVKSILDKEFEMINKDLYDNYNGILFLRSDYSEFSPNILFSKEKDTFPQFWDSLMSKMIKKDRTKYSFLKDDYKELFYPSEKHNNSKMFIDIGSNLTDSKYIQIQNTSNKEDKSKYYFLDFSFEFIKNLSEVENSYVLILNGNLNINNLPFNNILYQTFPTGGKEGFKENLDEVAESSQGSKMLGILRMDVDNLGLIFRDGLRNYNSVDKSINYYSISRMTTLSSQLILFFSINLEKIVRRFSKEKKLQAEIVYSGGDDLFIIGQWDIIPDLAIEIKNKFEEFVCKNPAFSLSGGVATTQGKYPIYRSAEIAGEAEETAKKYNRSIYNENNQKEQIEKNAICFLGQPFDWVEFAEIKKIVENISKLKDVKKLVSRINLIAMTFQKCKRYNKKLAELKNIDSTQIENFKKLVLYDEWLWRMVYSFSRLKSNVVDTEIIENLEKYFKNNQIHSIDKKGIENSYSLGIWTHMLNREI